MQQLADWGYTTQSRVRSDTVSATLITLEGADGPETWITFENFYAISRYNKSPLYSLAVYQVGHRRSRHKRRRNCLHHEGKGCARSRDVDPGILDRLRAPPSAPRPATPATAGNCAACPAAPNAGRPLRAGSRLHACRCPGHQQDSGAGAQVRTALAIRQQIILFSARRKLSGIADSQCWLCRAYRPCPRGTGNKFHGYMTSDFERYDMDAYTAAQDPVAAFVCARDELRGKQPQRDRARQRSRAVRP